MDDTSTIDRRSVLKAAAVGVGTGLSASGGAGARRSARAATRAEVAALDEQTASLRGLLADDGVLDGGRQTDLAAEPNAKAALGPAREGAAYLAGDGVPDEVVSVTAVDAGTLAVTVRPATGRAYALLDHGDGLRLYDPDAGVRDVETLSCGGCSTDFCGTDDDNDLYYNYTDIDCDGRYEARYCGCS